MVSDVRLRTWTAPVIEAYRSGKPIALFLDYDGTLTPIVRHPSLARLSPLTRYRIDRFKALPGWTIGIVTGRPLREIRELVAIEGIYYAGSSGLEIDLLVKELTFPEAQKYGKILDLIQDYLLETLRKYPGTWIERKTSSIAVHYRHLAPLSAVCFQCEVAKVLDCLPMFRHRIASEAIEVSPANGWDKGTAVETILSQCNIKVFPVYIGDSPNDLEAMTVVHQLGGIAVGIGDDAPTIAQYRLETPAELDHTLDQLLAELQPIDAPATAGCGTSQGISLELRPPQRPTGQNPIDSFASAEAEAAFADALGILIVSSDGKCRENFAEEFQRRGWRVWTASKPGDAVATLHRLGDAIKLALIDFQLPGFEGMKLMGQLRECDSSLVTCAISRNIDPYVATAFRRMSGTALFIEPFHFDVIESKLRRLLNDSVNQERQV